MGLSKKNVDYVAKLARIKLSDEEMEEFTPQLDSIVSYVEQLNQLDLTSVEPMAHILPIKNISRSDAPTPSLNRESVLDIAPSVKDGHIKVPKVIE